jgi:hypothetical protein
MTFVKSLHREDKGSVWSVDLVQHKPVLSTVLYTIRFLGCPRAAHLPAAAAAHLRARRPSGPSPLRPAVRRTSVATRWPAASRPHRRPGTRTTGTRGSCRPPCRYNSRRAGRYSSSSRQAGRYSSSSRQAGGKPQISWMSWPNSSKTLFHRQVFCQDIF